MALVCSSLDWRYCISLCRYIFMAGMVSLQIKLWEYCHAVKPRGIHGENLVFGFVKDNIVTG